MGSIDSHLENFSPLWAGIRITACKFTNNISYDNPIAHYIYNVYEKMICLGGAAPSLHHSIAKSYLRNNC